MFAKLTKLEHKLGNIEIEDLQHLDIDSSDSFYAEILDIFLEKYAHSFKIREVLEDKRDFLVLTLIRKLEIMTSSLRTKPSLKLKVLQNVCDSIRVCLREPMDLKPNQIAFLLKSLITIIVNFLHFGRELSLAALRCLINVLNKHPDRMEIFVENKELNGCQVLLTLLQNDQATIATAEQSNCAESKDEAGKSRSQFSDIYKAQEDKHLDNDRNLNSGDISGSESKQESKMTSTESFSCAKTGSEAAGRVALFDLSLIHYCVKILYMICCQSEEALYRLKGNVSVLNGCIYRLSRCLLNNHSPPSSSTSTASSVTTTILEHFPYTEENSILFTDLCKLLYILDVYTTLENCGTNNASSSSTYVNPSETLTNYLLEEYAVHKDIFKDIEIQSIEEISLHIRSSSNTNTNTSSNDASVEKKATSGLIWNPLIGIPALDLLNAVILITLTISPLYLKLLYNNKQDTYSNNYYIGKLADCEDAALQLLLLASDDTLKQNLFISRCDEGDVTTGKIINRRMNTSDHDGHTSSIVNTLQGLLQRKKFLSNTLIRILNRVLLSTKSMDLTEKCAMLTPILIVLSKLVKYDKKAQQSVKLLVFPTHYYDDRNEKTFKDSNSRSGISGNTMSADPKQSAAALTPTSSASVRKAQQQSYYNLPMGGVATKSDEDNIRSAKATATSSNNMDPRDCPVNTLRHELIKLMTSLDTQIKRVAAEFIFSLCDNNVNEFVYRTGFGNSVALLQLKGIL